MTAPRTDQLEAFLTLLKDEGRPSVLGLDCGTGTDGLRCVRAGIHFTGVDASEENIHAARAHGLSASVATGRALPFADAAFAAVWAPDALAALTPLEQDDAVRELTRVAGPGAPVAVVFPEWHSHHHSAGFTVLRSPG